MRGRTIGTGLIGGFWGILVGVVALGVYPASTLMGQTNAASAEEGAAAGEELSAQAEATMKIVRELSALVDKASAGSAAAAHAPARRRETAKVAQFSAPAKSKAAHVAPKTAEEEIPLQSSGTFGSF